VRSVGAALSGADGLGAPAPRSTLTVPLRREAAASGSTAFLYRFAVADPTAITSPQRPFLPFRE